MKTTPDYCCEDMKRNLTLSCEIHPDIYKCPDRLVDRHSNGNIGIIIHDGGSSHIEIKYCPWCGKNLNNEIGTIESEEMLLLEETLKESIELIKTLCKDEPIEPGSKVSEYILSNEGYEHYMTLRELRRRF